MEKASNYTPLARGRKKYRARRLAFHPERQHRSDREEFLTRALNRSLEKLAEKPGKPDASFSSDAVKKMQDQLLASRAELANFRKRTQREKEDLKKYASDEFLTAMAPALDSFDHALDALEKDHDAEALAKGIQAIHQQLWSALEGQGLERIHPLHETFDPNVHEALSVQQSDEHPHNSVVQVYQNGYKLHDRLLRPARVVIAQKLQ